MYDRMSVENINRMKKTFAVVGLCLAVGFASLITQANGTAQESPASQSARATLAGGCFWCMEEAFEKVDGVTSVVSGYIGGTKENPTYEQVSSGGTGHYEAIEVLYDPARVTHRDLLEAFWRNVDPTDGSGQFCDKGSQYRAAIFYQNEEEKQLSEESKKALEASKPFPEAIATQILPASMFYAAEDYHQDYYKKNPVRYRYYKWGCGRAQRLEELWGPPDKDK